jgi:chorismate dehydratase
MNKIKIAAVSYLNTKPFLYGLEKSEIKNQIDLQTFIPSVCAKKLVDGEVDLGLIPVAAIPQLNDHYIVSDYCIGAVGAVNSVLILSDVPIKEITTLYLDYQSRTSVVLAQVLLKNYWKKEVQLLPAQTGFESKIARTTAGVVIGDRALILKENYNYVYDLAEVWFEFTKLPFVFACWVANKKLAIEFINEFNAACKFGIEHINELTEQLKSENDFYPETKNYLTHFISYTFDEEKQKGLALFQEYLKAMK